MSQERTKPIEASVASKLFGTLYPDGQKASTKAAISPIRIPGVFGYEIETVEPVDDFQSSIDEISSLDDDKVAESAIDGIPPHVLGETEFLCVREARGDQIFEKMLHIQNVLDGVVSVPQIQYYAVLQSTESDEESEGSGFEIVESHQPQANPPIGTGFVTPLSEIDELTEEETEALHNTEIHSAEKIDDMQPESLYQWVRLSEGRLQEIAEIAAEKAGPMTYEVCIVDAPDESAYKNEFKSTGSVKQYQRECAAYMHQYHTHFLELEGSEGAAQLLPEDMDADETFIERVVSDLPRVDGLPISQDDVTEFLEANSDFLDSESDVRSLAMMHICPSATTYERDRGGITMDSVAIWTDPMVTHPVVDVLSAQFGTLLNWRARNSNDFQDFTLYKTYRQMSDFDLPHPESKEFILLWVAVALYHLRLLDTDEHPVVNRLTGMKDQYLNDLLEVYVNTDYLERDITEQQLTDLKRFTQFIERRGLDLQYDQLSPSQ